VSFSITVDSEAAMSRVIDRLQTNWRQHARRGRALVVTIEHSEQPRTVKQLRRWWKLMRFIAANAEVAGQRFSAEHWDEHFRRELIGVEQIHGESYALDTSEHSIGEYNDLMRAVESFATGELRLNLEQME
jgi:hypothetical protein